MEKEIKLIVNKFLEKSKSKETLIVSHFDTDGITSAAVMIQSLKGLDRKFSVKIVKSLEEKFIYELPKDNIILFLDLASGSLNHIKKAGLKDVFIIDHHEVVQEIPECVTILNPMLNTKESINSSSLTYLFCKEINPENKKFAKLAVLGMIGDWLEKSIDKLNNSILEEGGIIKKRGLLIYPSTRPLNRTLEYSSQPYIQGVTGNSQGVLELLREAEVGYVNKKYKSLIELDEEEMKKLVTSIMLRNPKTKIKNIIGDIFLLKFFNKLEDARELCALINGCSRLGKSDTALKFCMEISGAKKEAESIYVKYKQHLISALDFVSKTEKIQDRGFVIINAGDKITDTIIGTITSILANSSIYEDGTIITSMAYYGDKIKISARNVGRIGRNVREILDRVIKEVGGEVGGHEFAAGCNIDKSKEKKFIDALRKNLEVELVKI
ncbi:MAG TPA: DHH family phosphoesterase [Candidatus Pacearchaeota archaeon]|nr:DHH family phosphoesterase [Candidatus Pacearchaeota archaeon]